MSRLTMKRFLALALTFCPVHPGADTAMTPEELEEWFLEDEQSSTDRVNEGELVFLHEPPPAPVLHSHNALSVDQESMDNGWVSLEQCYSHLDPVPDAEIVYQYKSIRDLRVTSSRNIETLQVKGQLVELDNVGRNARLCVQAEVRIFYRNPDTTFSLRNGPFHRRFLDGYFPYHVTLEIDYPPDLLTLVKTEPTAQAGFKLTRSAGTVLVDTYFEGILNTEIIFKAARDQ